MSTLAVIGNISCDTTEYPDRTRHLLGGAALYIALAAARHGIDAAPISVIGHDLADALTRPPLTTLDLTGIAQVDQPTCRFHLCYDHQHTLTAADAVYGAADQLTTHALTHTDAHRHVHVCCRRPLDPAAVLADLTQRRQPFSVDFIGTSAADMIAATARYLPHARLICTDRREYAILARTVPVDQLPAVTVTDGPRPACLYQHGAPTARVPVPRSEPVEVTGAGDTFTGTFIAELLHGVPAAQALRAAVQAASARITAPGITWHPRPP